MVRFIVYRGQRPPLENRLEGPECKQKPGSRDPSLDWEPWGRVWPDSCVGDCCHHLYLQGIQGLPAGSGGMMA